MNRLSLRQQLVQIQGFRKTTNPFRGIHGSFLQFNKGKKEKRKKTSVNMWRVGLAVYSWQSFCEFLIFDTQKFAQNWNAHQLTRTIQNLTCSATCEENNHTSIDTTQIEMTRTTRHVTLKWHLKRENGRTARVLSFLTKDYNYSCVHFARASPWLFIIPITKPFLDFVHLLLKRRTKD